MGSVLKSLWNIKQQSESCHKPEERMSNDGKVEVKENQIDAYYQLESSVDGDQFHSQIELESDDTSVDNRKTMSVGEVDNMTDSCQTTLDESEIGVGNGGGEEIVPRLVCEDEGRMGGHIFDPPLYLQRYSFVSDKLKCLKAQSVVDIGCSECQICRYFADISSVQQIALVDMDRRLLEKHKYQIRPSVFHYLDKRKHPLTVRLYHGDATVLDTRMLGYDAVSMIEFIEHLYPDDLRKVSHVVFHELRPRIVIVTTPNFEFNQLFPADGRTFRHPDHKFEWTREEFQRWGDLQAGNHGYCVQYTGVGDPPPKNRHLGYCSQAAIFEKVNANKVPQPSENCNQTYTLIAEVDYPYQEDVSSPSDLLSMEVEYNIRELLKGENYTELEPDKVVLHLSVIMKYRRLAKLCDNSIDRLRDHLTDGQFTLTEDLSGVIVCPSSYFDTEEFRFDDLDDDNDENDSQVNVESEHQIDVDERASLSVSRNVTGSTFVEECWD